MRSVFLVSALMLLLSMPLYGLQHLNAGFTYAVYKSPQQGTYVETWLSVNASTVKFVEQLNGMYGAEVEVLLIFQQGDEVVNYMKYQLSSPVVDDTTQLDFAFLDRQRFLLAPGVYDLEISLRDVNSNQPAAETITLVEVDIPSDTISLSTIQLLERVEKAEVQSELTRGGFDLYPDFYAFLPEHVKRLSFYCEAYHTAATWGENTGFLYRSWIESFETGVVVNNISHFQRGQAGEVVPFLHTFNIANLPTGNYHLVAEVRDQENTKVAERRVFFQRSNPQAQLRLQDIAAIDVKQTFSKRYTNADTLADYIRSCMPIATEQEKLFADNILALRNVEHMQQFLYHFWNTRIPASPEQGWLNYLRQVERVNMSFGTFIKKGYETDRGIIWLRYGEPNSIYNSVHEPEAYPYEIWHYYQLTQNQHNRRFVFVNFGIGAGDYELAHSNATGEMQDPQWHLRLHGRHMGGTNIDRVQYDDTYGSRALQIFNNPF